MSHYLACDAEVQDWTDICDGLLLAWSNCMNGVFPWCQVTVTTGDSDIMVQ